MYVIRDCMRKVLKFKVLSQMRRKAEVAEHPLQQSG